MLRFGTDGVRGDADTQLPTDLVRALGRAAVGVFGTAATFGIGCDTRASGPRVATDLADAIVAAGGSVEQLGVIPTPGVAFWSAEHAAPAAVISASHNVWSDNGIKLFAPGGLKLSDDQQTQVEAIANSESTESPVGGAGSAVADGADAARVSFERHLCAALDGRRLDGLRIVLDCANGAAHAVGPEVFGALGAEVVALATEPDGRNINADCGSTHPGALQRAVVEREAALGIALDGDADRCLAVDGEGRLVDGDQILVALALDLEQRGELPGPAVVVTVMSNLGLRRALVAAGIEVVETPVGDRHILAALETRRLGLGGEQSGHVIVRRLATTGDGVLTGLLLADLIVRSGRSLADLAGQMTIMPQLLRSVRVAAGFDLNAAGDLWAAVRAVEAELGEHGRVLVRASGTEPVVRVMVEAPTDELATAAVDRIAAQLA